MKYINNKECIWNPTTDCLGCPSQPTCEATLKDIAAAMWEENQKQKETLQLTLAVLNKANNIIERLT
jgi:hypothetical protein